MSLKTMPCVHKPVASISLLISIVWTCIAYAQHSESSADPKAVIPSHYFISGLTTETSGLTSADSWVNEQERLNHGNVDRLDGAELTLNPGKLKRSHHRVYYFADHFEK